MSSIYDRIPSSLRIALAAIWPAALLLYGLWSFPLAIFGPDRELIPGDLGDARFNNYILEHFHQYATGKVDAYWDAPFMYPYKNVIALSDNLLGSAPLYSLFRHVGYNRESAFQFWVLAVFALNYLCCYIALVLWSKRSALAAAGAFVFAFGIHMIGHLEHAQVFPKFMVPMAFWFCWQWLRSGKVRHFLFTGLAVVYQFYCGIYLGFMLCYALLFLVAGYLLVNRTIMGRIRNPNWSVIRSSAGVLVLSAGLLLPLMLPYMEVANSLGTRTFDEVKATIPRPVSYFFTHPAAMSWRSLSGHSQFAFDEWWSHFHFMGAVPWLAIFLLPGVAWRANVEPAQRKGLLAIGIALVLSTVFCLRIGDFTLYKLIYKLPGFSAMRAIDRIVTVQAMYFALLTTLVFSLVGKRPWQKALIGLCIPLMIVVDNKVEVDELKRFNKYAARKLVDRIVIDMQLQRDTTAAALAYTPARCLMPFEEDHQRTINLHLSAMLAGQQIGVPIVNSYTGSYPGNYMKFWNALERKPLEDWCEFNNTSAEGIQLVNNIRQPILSTDTVYLMASNGAYVCLNSTQENRAIGDRPAPFLWETFVLLELSPSHFAFLAHNDMFLSAEIHHDGRLSATSDQLGDMGIFIGVPLADDQVALLADNGKYVELDRANNGLVAHSDSIGPDTRFRILR
ncbi:MAG TPA: hypothetical protein PK149_07665 [Flavobacteriales bacterium]|nr:hypothetical protein [Flavobacteriales bacterium]